MKGIMTGTGQNPPNTKVFCNSDIEKLYNPSKRYFRDKFKIMLDNGKTLDDCYEWLNEEKAKRRAKLKEDEIKQKEKWEEYKKSDQYKQTH